LPYAFYERTADGAVRDITDELPFDIPETWEWVRLGTLINKLTDGTHSTPKYIENGVPFLSVKDISNGKLNFDNTKYVSHEEHAELCKRCDPEFGDILLTKVGTTGIPVLIDTDLEFSLFVSVALLKFSQNLLIGKYLVKLLESPLVGVQCEENTRGVGNKNWVIRDIANTLIVLPPLAEQRRIVARIEELLPHVADYDVAEQKLTALNTSFPDALKKSILQSAVQGKLVPQDPNDEPASVLLGRIRAEKEALIKVGKIKRDKRESVIFRRDNSHYERLGGIERCIDDEIPFDLPENWAWARLGDVVYNHGQMTPQGNFCYIDIGSLDNEQQQLNAQETIISAAKAPSRARKIVERGDILYSTVRPYLHNMCIVDKPFSHIPIASTGFAVMACYQILNNRYLFYYLLSPNFDNYANDTENAKGVAYPAINDARLYNALVPLPPLAEQERITRRVEELLTTAAKF
jgi:type I restriction enzyme S subunit